MISVSGWLTSLISEAQDLGGRVQWRKAALSGTQKPTNCTFERMAQFVATQLGMQSGQGVRAWSQEWEEGNANRTFLDNLTQQSHH